MEERLVFIIGGKESFIIRVLVKKLKEAGIEAAFVKTGVNTINAAMSGHEHAQMTLFLDTDEKLPHDVMSFLKDKMTDEGRQFILIGDAGDTRRIIDNMPGNLIYKTFNRPLNNDDYVKTVSELFGKIEAGEYKKSILIVDDDPTYMGLVREWLKDEFRVSMANSGLQAIKWLGKNHVDLILLDHEMPVTSGPQVLEMLRSDEDTRSIPVIFLTGKGDKESVMQVVALKPEGYLLKTIDRAELLSNLRNFFKTGKVQV
ncbi:MAG: response regulator [Lachnospiraceae bacterium]|nr:response regulator [Lachnospiraceae bacterium]